MCIPDHMKKLRNTYNVKPQFSEFVMVNVIWNKVIFEVIFTMLFLKTLFEHNTIILNLWGGD